MITEFITAVYMNRKIEALKLGRLNVCYDNFTGPHLLYNMDDFKEQLTENSYTVSSKPIEVPVASDFNELQLRQYMSSESCIYLFSGLAVKADSHMDFICKDNITLDYAAEKWKLNEKFNLANRINLPDNEMTRKLLQIEKELYTEMSMEGLFVKDEERLFASTLIYESHMLKEIEMSPEDFGQIFGMQ